MLSLFGLGRKTMSKEFKAKLPALNSFVALAMTGGGPRGSVSVETIGEQNLSVSVLPGIKAGGTGIFSYENSRGRFRFSSRCLDVRAAAVFSIPVRVETLQTFSGASARTAVRLDATVPAQWRFAPGGKGSGEYVRASLTDISRSGASLIVDRDVRVGTLVEARFSIGTLAAPVVLLGEVMRSEAIESTKKTSLGLRFQGITPDEDRAIMEFINRRHAERRNRGLA
jgi:hypothetical protein